MKVLVFFSILLSFSLKAQVQVRDVGVIGLMSHDLFSWDPRSEQNRENGRLDLSTIFDYNQGLSWQQGGDPKNAENSPVFSVTMELVEYYSDLVKTHSALVARQQTVVYFHSLVSSSLKRMTGVEFPETTINQSVDNLEQASLRALHDILPGKIKLYDRVGRSELVVTDVRLAKTRLNLRELNQEISYYNGDYDKEYEAIEMAPNRFINLKKVDATFIEKFSPYTQSEMLSELAQVGRGELLIEDVSFHFHIQEMIAKGLCGKDNIWMPQERKCE